MTRTELKELLQEFAVKHDQYWFEWDEWIDPKELCIVFNVEEETEDE